MSNAPVILTAKIRPDPARLLSIWFFLILLPAFYLNLTTDRILSSGEELLKEKVKSQLVQEITHFRDDLGFASYMQQKLQVLNSLSDIKTQTAEQLSNTIASAADLQICAIFAIPDDSEEFSFYIKESIATELGMISRTILKNLLNYLNNSYVRQSPSDKTKKALGENSQIQSQSLLRGMSYLRSLFAAAGELSLKPFIVAPAFSGKPGLSRMLFYYHPFISRKSKKNGGFICAVRERDISLRQLLGFAMDNQLFSGLKRDYIVSFEGNAAVYGPGKTTQDFCIEADGSISLSGSTSQEHLLRLISQGTLYPHLLGKTIKKQPLLKVIAPALAMQHPLRAVFHRTRLPALITVLLISILLLRIYLFGYGQHLKISPRLFLAVIGASALPFSAFLAAATYNQNFQQEFVEAEIQQYIQLQADQLCKSIDSHVNSKELQIAALSQTLGFSGDSSVDYLRHWQKQNGAAVIVYSDSKGEQTLRNKPEYQLNSLEKDVVDMTFQSIWEALQPPGKKQSDEILGLVKLKSKGLGWLLENLGILHNAINSNYNCVYSILPVFPDNMRFNAPSALLLIKFFNHEIIEEFLRTRPELRQNETRGDFQIQRCFIPLFSPMELPPRQTFLATPDFNFDSAMNLARKTARSRSTITWIDDQSMTVALFLQKLNCVILVKAQRLTGQATHSIPWYFMIAAYFFVLVLTMVLLLGKMLVQPINLLKIATEKIAAGNYAHRIDFRSGDEFEPLTQAFNSMTASLRQKEELSSYVSETVMQEISANTGLTLFPGGERIEVCVLFCSLAGFKEAGLTREADEITTMLSRLIDTVDSIATMHNGVMDKLIEDTAMLVFRQTDSSDHVLSACRAALAISAALPQPDCPFRIKIGIASGPAVSGKIGSAEGKLDFTVIGNPVNLAARLKVQAGKAANTGIIVCPATIRLLKGQARLRFIERTEIKGRSRTFPLYELMAIR